MLTLITTPTLNDSLDLITTPIMNYMGYVCSLGCTFTFEGCTFITENA